jgi:type II secretory pathway predicted ATPase ExeA
VKPLDKRLARFGLSANPFTPATPPAFCHLTPEMQHVLSRCQHLVGQGGFALITGETGTGKSTLLRCLHARLQERDELVLGVLSRPQASLADFYRELGALFGVTLTPHNRWAGAQVLRERWSTHWGTTNLRPVLFLDEAQDMRVAVLNELRLLTTAALDTDALLTVFLAGDQRLVEQFQTPELLPLASRLRIQYRTGPAKPEELRLVLDHLLAQAGNRKLMTDGLKATCVEHACGNRRVLIHLGAELLDAALEDHDCESLDEQLFTRVVRPQQAPGALRSKKSA